MTNNLSQEIKKRKEEYDFSNAEQGKFYIPVEEIELPIYLDKDIIEFFNQKYKLTQENLQTLVNDLIRKDIEIARRVAFLTGDRIFWFLLESC